MSQSGMKDFDPESFTLQKYVEKLAQLDPRTGLGPLSKSRVEPFDAQVLLESFLESMKGLQELADKNKRRVDKLGHVCHKQEKEHAARIGELEGLYTEAFAEFQVLEERITSVSTKVVHLGDQLESSNNRRTRAMEAQNLMRHLEEFEKPKPALPIFTDPSRRLEAAGLIFKLQLLSSELPSGGEDKRFKAVKENIAAKYAEIESQLVDAFIDSQRSLDTKRMRMYAQALSPFPLGCQKVVDNFIAHNIPLQQFQTPDDMFAFIEDRLCRKIHDQIKEVFDNPEMVITKYIQTVIDKVIQKRVENELRHLVNKMSDKEKYLTTLYSLYQKAMKFQGKVARLKIGIDPVILPKLTRVIFSKYLSSYSEIETQHLDARSASTLADFQNMVGISRKPGTKLMVTANKQQPHETYVSQEVCTSILHEAKWSIKRSKDLLTDRELSDTAKDIYFTVLEKLCVEHFHTALDIALSVDLKMAPVGYFCITVGNINNNMHLIEKLFRETIMPCIFYPSVATACVDRKRDVSSKLERKIETGIEKSISHMVNSVKQLLTTYQKKLDYRPETPLTEGTQACSQAVSHISECCQVLRLSLDGKNLDIVLMELGVRLHRVLFDHIQQFIINELGAMVIICDMNDYRRVIKDFKNSFLDELFENMQTLCNIFVVKAENLGQVCSEEPYANFDRSVLQTMIQLRSDYKTAKLQKLNF